MHACLLLHLQRNLIIHFSVEIRDLLLFKNFLDDIMSKEKSYPNLSMVNIKYPQYSGINLKSHTRHFPDRLESEMEELNLKDSFWVKLKYLRRSYYNSVDAKTKSLLTPSENEKFLEAMFGGMTSDHIEHFLHRHSKLLSHRIANAAKMFSIDMSVLDHYWKRIMKPALLNHLQPTQIRSRMISNIIHLEAQNPDEVDLKRVIELFPGRDEQELKNLVIKIAGDPTGELPLFETLLSQPTARLLYKFDEIRGAFKN